MLDLLLVVLLPGSRVVSKEAPPGDDLGAVRQAKAGVRALDAEGGHGEADVGLLHLVLPGALLEALGEEDGAEDGEADLDEGEEGLDEGLEHEEPVIPYLSLRSEIHEALGVPVGGGPVVAAVGGPRLSNPREEVLLDRGPSRAVGEADGQTHQAEAKGGEGDLGGEDQPRPTPAVDGVPRDPAQEDGARREVRDLQGEGEDAGEPEPDVAHRRHCCSGLGVAVCRHRRVWGVDVERRMRGLRRRRRRWRR